MEQGRLQFIGTFRSAATVDYICVTCGYLERHVAPGKALDRIAMSWNRLVPREQTGPHDQVPPGYPGGPTGE